jgi:endoplasmic reticulum resident protein 44
MREKKIQTSVEVRVVDVYYFYTTWCPYCVKARPEWDKFKKFWENKKKNGYMLNFTEIDCDKNESLASKYEIETYPTIKLVKDGKVYDYDAKPSVENLNKFLNVCFE